MSFWKYLTKGKQFTLLFIDMLSFLEFLVTVGKDKKVTEAEISAIRNRASSLIKKIGKVI